MRISRHSGNPKNGIFDRHELISEIKDEKTSGSRRRIVIAERALLCLLNLIDA